ncbi:MAG: polymer-forming cytoskeletal protein [Fidelibacterota bacterium]
MGKIDFQNVHTMIGADVVIRGNVELEGGIIIYGSIFGDVSTQGPVRVARTGRVTGNINASDIRVGGHIEGNITVSNRAELGQHSSLNGDLTCSRLLIEEGASFAGACDMQSAGESSPVSDA